MNGNERCETCQFFTPSSKLAVDGWCRRYVPQIVVIDNEVATQFPHINYDDWCGEHEQRSK